MRNRVLSVSCGLLSSGKFLVDLPERSARLENGREQSLFVIFACPVASVVLNYAELVGEGQGTAANLVLLSVLTSIVTLPLLTLMLGLF